MRTRLTCLLLTFGLLTFGLLLSACDSSDPDPNPPGITGVSVSAPVEEMTVGETLQFTAQVQPATAPQGVTWTSTDESIATVDAAGLVTAVGPGTVAISARSTADPSRSGSLAFEVVGGECPTPRDVPGIIGSDVTLENWVAPPECIDYVAGRTSISSAIITIEPGVRLAFEAGRSFVIRGDNVAIHAVGTSAEPVVLTGLEETTGYWGALWLDGTANAQNRIEHVVIEHGGTPDVSGSITKGALLLTGDTETTLQNVTVRESASYGLSMRDTATLREHGGNVFTSNASGPAYVYASQVHFLDATSTGDDNGNFSYVGVYATDIETAVTWVRFGNGYRIEQRNDRYAFEVRGAAAFLTLEAGVRIEFEEDMAMTVADGAGIAALGTASAPVVLSGDQPERGYWRGFRTFSDNPNQRFNHVFVEYGGGDTHSGSVQPGNVYLDDGAYLRITNSVLRDSEGYGLVVRAGASLPDFNGNAIHTNLLGAAHVRADVAEDLTATSTYTGNGRDVIDIYAYVNRITTPTTWEDLGVPYVITDQLGGFSIDETSFTVGAGTEILFQGDNGIQITGGTLAFEGTETNPIRLGGDGGAWGGITVLNSTATFDHTTIDAAGLTAGYDGSTGAVAITRSQDLSSSAVFGPGTTHANTAGDGYGIVFGHGDTSANCGPMEPVDIPAGDEASDHCL